MPLTCSGPHMHMQAAASILALHRQTQSKAVMHICGKVNLCSCCKNVHLLQRLLGLC